MNEETEIIEASQPYACWLAYTDPVTNVRHEYFAKDSRDNTVRDALYRLFRTKNAEDFILSNFRFGPYKG